MTKRFFYYSLHFSNIHLLLINNNYIIYAGVRACVCVYYILIFRFFFIRTNVYFLHHLQNKPNSARGFVMC